LAIVNRIEEWPVVFHKAIISKGLRLPSDVPVHIYPN